MVEAQGRKEGFQQDLEKGRVILELKMHLMFQAGAKKVHEKEQRTGMTTIADDLRAVYMRKRERAKEARALQERINDLHMQEKDEEEAAQVLDELREEANTTMSVNPLVSLDDVDDILGSETQVVEPYKLPQGFKAIATPPPASELVGFAT